MTRVGLTGGIASGKSTVSAWLREHGAVVIDYDALARRAVDIGSTALRAIEDRFGSSVIAADGSLDRPALGAIVFSDEAARRDLEAITHPAIRALAVEAERSAPSGAVVVHDHPLLVEMGLTERMDTVVVVDVPEGEQVRRMVDDRGMTESDAAARIAAQTPRETRLAAADVVLTNTGTLDDLQRAVEVLWDDLSA